MNKIILIGRTTKDIELRYTPNNVAVASFSLAVNRDFKNQEGEYETDFFNCIAYRGIGETIANYVRKGDLLAVEGRVQNRTYQNQEGTTKYVTEVIVENIQFLQPKKQEEKIAPAEEPVEEPIERDPFENFGDVTEYELPF